ncbi:hypothetical protein AB0I60_33100 [Actinosynnema sp. NPDC050436]|uniref:hypothetical protein n=1 Tax=Actinosynnema sp. NPDC050436 TaxID=3155659 RepID=UPI0033F00DA5
MSRTSVSNETGGLLCLWVEPAGTDHWLRPGEEFTVVTSTVEESPFNVVVHDEGVTVWVNSGADAEVVDRSGTPVPSGHQRPADAD